MRENQKLAELKRRLASLKKSPIFAKPAAAEEALICAVEVLDEMEIRLINLEKGAGDGTKEKNRRGAVPGLQA